MGIFLIVISLSTCWQGHIYVIFHVESLSGRPNVLCSYKLLEGAVIKNFSSSAVFVSSTVGEHHVLLTPLYYFERES